MAVKRAYKYPRLKILLLIIFLTFFLFSNREFALSQLGVKLGIFGAILTGVLYVFSFTSFTASAILLSAGKSQNLFLYGILAALGSVLGDLVIFKTARLSFQSEFKELYKEPFFKKLSKIIPKPVLHFLKIVLAMIIIASPLPDEAGVTLLANGFAIPKLLFSIVSFILNGAGIFFILYLGSVL